LTVLATERKESGIDLPWLDAITALLAQPLCGTGMGCVSKTWILIAM
jgi:hypothetical protein